MLQPLVRAVFNDVTSGLGCIGFRVTRQRRFEESLLFVDTQDGAIFARGGRLARCRQRGGPRWRFSDDCAGWIDAGSLAELRGLAPWLPADEDLHPVLHALRSGAALPLRSVATRDVTLVMEEWSFRGPYSAPEDNDRAGAARPDPEQVGGAATGERAQAREQAVVVPAQRSPAAQKKAASKRTEDGTDGRSSAAGVNGADRPPAAAVPEQVRAVAPCWYLEPDAGPPHDHAYVNLVLTEHAALLGCRQGQPAPRWDPLANGLQLLGRLPPGLPVPRPLRLQRGDRLVTLLSKSVRLQGLRLASCLDGVLHDRHPEYVHDARVATRRARFALRIAARADRQQARDLRDRLGTLAQLLGPVRDLDVLFPRLSALADAAYHDLHGADRPAAHTRDQALRRLEDALHARRAERLQQAQEGLPRAELAYLPSLLSHWGGTGGVDEPVTAVAGAAIRTALAQAIRVGGAATAPTAARVDDLHRLRLRLKRLRYTAELFAGALPRRSANRALESIVTRCAAAQTTLGELNDDAVAAIEIRAVVPLLESAGGGPAAGAAAALARAILERLKRRELAAAQDFGRRWPRLRKRLTDAVAGL